MAEEDKSLREYVEAHGEGNWNQVQRNTRLNQCGKSCRLRWANNLRLDLKTGPFDDEDQRIIERHAMMGNKWAQMVACELGLLPGSPVGTSLIDAHASGVGVLESVPDLESKKQYATTWSWFVEHLHATWLSQRTNYLSLMSGGPFLQWYLSFGSLKVAKVQLVLYLITLLKTMLLLPFLLITLLLKVYPYMSC